MKVKGFVCGMIIDDTRAATTSTYNGSNITIQ